MPGDLTNKSWWPPAVVGSVTVIGFVLRFLLFGHAAFGDELSTLWIIRENGLGDVVHAVASDAEISPPFYFLLAEVASITGDGAAAVRLPSLVAGVATVPIVYLIGVRTIGRTGAQYATAIAAVSPFLVYFSANARAYSVMILMLTLGTLALLQATENEKRWLPWILWAVASALALYSHYTTALVIAGQFFWVLAFFPNLRMKALTGAALTALLFAPWIANFFADLNSPTSVILESLQGDGFAAKREATGQLLFLRVSPDSVGLWSRLDMLLGLGGILLAAAAVVFRLAAGRLRRPNREQGAGACLVVILAFAVPAGELLLLLAGTDIYGARNLAATWVGLPLFLGGLAVAAGRRAGPLAAALMIAGFGLATVHLADSSKTTIAYDSAAESIEAEAAPGDTVLDASIISPAPLGPLDAYLDGDFQIYEMTNLENRPDFIEDVFDPYDPQLIADEAFSGSGPVYLVTIGDERSPEISEDSSGEYRFGVDTRSVQVPPGWTSTSRKRFEDLETLTVTTFMRERTDKP